GALSARFRHSIHSRLTEPCRKATSWSVSAATERGDKRPQPYSAAARTPRVAMRPKQTNNPMTSRRFSWSNCIQTAKRASARLSNGGDESAGMLAIPQPAARKRSYQVCFTSMIQHLPGGSVDHQPTVREDGAFCPAFERILSPPTKLLAYSHRASAGPHLTT